MQERYSKEKAEKEADKMREFVSEVSEYEEDTAPEDYKYAEEMVHFNNALRAITKKALADPNVTKLARDAENEVTTSSSIGSYLKSKFPSELKDLSVFYDNDYEKTAKYAADFILEMFDKKVDAEISKKSIIKYDVKFERAFEEEFTEEEIFSVIEEIDGFKTSDMWVGGIKKDKNGKTVQIGIGVAREKSLERFGKYALYFLFYPAVKNKHLNFTTPVITRMLNTAPPDKVTAESCMGTLMPIATYNGFSWTKFDENF